MSDRLRDQYRAAAAALAAELKASGFKVARSGDEMSRSRGAVVQRLALSFREPPGSGVGYIEVFPGVNFATLEAVAADLQSKKPRAGFITCSLDIGLLMPAGAAVQWELRADSDPAAATRSIIEAVQTFAVPFWNEFASLPDLLALYDAGDPRVCRGAEWPWRRVAACMLLGDTTRAVSLLNDMLTSVRPPMRPTVEHALERLSAASSSGA